MELYIIFARIEKMVIGMEQLTIAPLVSIPPYWPTLICWPTNRFIGQAHPWRINRNRGDFKSSTANCD
jgi:hypothetical protein